MIPLGFWEWFCLGGIVFVSAVIMGVGGFGFSLISIAFLPLLFPVKFVIPFSVTFSIFLNVFLLIQIHHTLDRKDLWPIFLGILLGVPIGVLALKNLDEWIIRKALAIFIMGYCLATLTSFFEMKKNLGLGWTYLAGFVGGSLKGAFGFGAPPIVMYVSAQRLEKLRARGIIIACNIFTAVLAVPLYSLTGLVNRKILLLNLLCSPIVILGVILGNYFFLKIDQALFRKMILLLLLVQGCLLLLR